MSKTVAQIFATNPTTVVADTDLYYLVQSPYTPGADAAISGLSLKAAFGSGGTINPGLANQLGYYASAGTTISGLTSLANGTLITSALGVPSISQTLPSAVQGNITALGTIATGVWNGTLIGGIFGGTGVNNGASTITIGGNVTFSGAFTFTGTLTGNTAVTFPTSGTLATTSQLLVSPLTTKGDIWVWSTTNDRLPVGTINGQILQAASGAATGLAWSTTTYPSTALNAARILRSDGTNYVDTTSTFADTYAASGFLYANGANNVAGLATANNGLPVTSNTGVPSILAGPGTTGNMLISNAAAAPSFTTFTYPTTVGASGSIHISNGTNIVSSTSLWPNTVGTARKVVISDGTSNVYSTETYAVPGTSGNVMTSDGTNWTSAAPVGVTLLTTKGDLFGFSTVNARVPVASGNGKVLQVDSTASVGVSYSTATFPATATGTGTLLRADGTNWVATTSTYPNTNAVSTLLYASSANVMAALATANSSVLVTDSSGVPSLSTTLPAFTTSSITFSPTTGGIVGTTTNDNVAAGKVGEFVSATVLIASFVSCTTATARDITSISLTAGDWQVWGNTGFSVGGTCTILRGWISSTSATKPDFALYSQRANVAVQSDNFSTPSVRFSLSGTTTVYLSCEATFSTSTVTAGGGIFARRMR